MSESPWINIKQAAERLQLSESFVKKAVAANRCPHRHIGRRVLIHRDELDRWADNKPGVRLEATA
jgi:excisionase family DNA binding protein